MFAGLGTAESVTVVPIGKCHVTSPCWEFGLGERSLFGYQWDENKLKSHVNLKPH